MTESARTVAIVEWGTFDALAQAIGNEVQRAGYAPSYFRFDSPPPQDASIILTFAPYGRWMQIPYALSQRQPRPLLVHWNTENPPDLRLPWAVMKPISDARAWMDRLHESPNSRTQQLLKAPPLRALDTRLSKFRYVGEYHYTARRGWLNVFAESSEIYADLHTRHGLPTRVVPWGTVPDWGADLKLERDIDVLWFGQRRSPRRSRLLDRVRGELRARGIEMYVADGVEKPFVHGAARTELLNRAKITLNLLPTWYDHAFPYRFHVAAVNRSMVLTEPMLRHCSLYEEGTHYVSAPIPQLAERLAYYVAQDGERRTITEQAYELVTTRMTMGHSVRALLKYAEEARGGELH